MPAVHAGLLSWRASLTLAFCVASCASAVGCVEFTDDIRPPEQMTTAPVSTHASMLTGSHTGSEAPDSVPSFQIPGRSFDTSVEDPTWRSLMTGAVATPCSVHVATRQAPVDADTCGKEKLIAQTAFLFRDDVPLRPPSRQLWFHHPRLIPVRGEESQIRRPYGEHEYRDRVSDDTFRNPYTGLRDLPLLHRDTARATVTDSELSDIGPPPPHHTLKTAVTLVGLTLLGAGMYAFGPSSFTGADTEENVWEEARDHFKEAWKKPPVFDKDGSGVNYVGHPFFGMQYYLSQRNYGESSLYSFLFSVGTSTFFEYFVESWSERPSVQDLIITPVVGSILGEIVYQATQHMRKDGFTTAEKIIITVINPLYVLQNGYH